MRIIIRIDTKSLEVDPSPPTPYLILVLKEKVKNGGRGYFLWAIFHRGGGCGGSALPQNSYKPFQGLLEGESYQLSG